MKGIVKTALLSVLCAGALFGAHQAGFELGRRFEQTNFQAGALRSIQYEISELKASIGSPSPEIERRFSNIEELIRPE